MAALTKSENNFELNTLVEELNQFSGERIDGYLGEMKDLPFLLIHLKDPENFSGLQASVLTELFKKLKSLNGAMVLVADRLDTKDLQTVYPVVPSYDEGVDYIYMEKIEKELLRDFGE